MVLCPTSQWLESRKKATPQPRRSTQEGTVAKGANIEDKPSPGTTQCFVQVENVQFF